MTAADHTESSDGVKQTLEEREKELQCIYRVSQALARAEKNIDDRLQAVADTLPMGWQFPEAAAARLTIDGRAYTSSAWADQQTRQEAPIVIDDAVVGQVTVGYHAGVADEQLDPFLPEEELLLGEIARRVAEFLNAEWQRERVDHLASQRASTRNRTVPREQGQTHHGLIGESPGMQAVYRAIERAASINATVLIQGESGTGKELVARAIHYESDRSAAHFVPVNCAAIPEALVESELFGFVKGAFTGATTTRAGFFQTADGGTIFLDEISEMNPSVQAKLLRVLQDQEVRMVGSDKTRRTDVRIVAATNKELPALVRAGEFRADLYFRLHVLPIEIPPLRDREGDVRRLLEFFAGRVSRKVRAEPLSFSERALRALERYEWPGNVRELENLVQRLAVMVDDSFIDITDLPEHMRTASKTGSKSTPDTELRSLQDVEQAHIARVLDSVDGNRTRAAEILGIDRTTLRRKLKNLES